MSQLHRKPGPRDPRSGPTRTDQKRRRDGTVREDAQELDTVTFRESALPDKSAKAMQRAIVDRTTAMDVTTLAAMVRCMNALSEPGARDYQLVVRDEDNNEIKRTSGSLGHQGLGGIRLVMQTLAPEDLSPVFQVTTRSILTPQTSESDKRIQDMIRKITAKVGYSMSTSPGRKLVNTQNNGAVWECSKNLLVGDSTINPRVRSPYILNGWMVIGFPGAFTRQLLSIARSLFDAHRGFRNVIIVGGTNDIPRNEVGSGVQKSRSAGHSLAEFLCGTIFSEDEEKAIWTFVIPREGSAPHASDSMVDNLSRVGHRNAFVSSFHKELRTQRTETLNLPFYFHKSPRPAVPRIRTDGSLDVIHNTNYDLLTTLLELEEAIPLTTDDRIIIGRHQLMSMLNLITSG